jgi:hypothetical protein
MLVYLEILEIGQVGVESGRLFLDNGVETTCRDCIKSRGKLGGNMDVSHRAIRLDCALENEAMLGAYRAPLSNDCSYETRMSLGHIR